MRPTKSAKGQRVYSRRDVETLTRVRELLYSEGFTIAGARKKLQKDGLEPRGDHNAAKSPQLREQLLELRAEIQSFLEELG